MPLLSCFRRRGSVRAQLPGDERITEDIYERLVQAQDIDSSDVSLDVRDGKVTLEGTVPDRRTKYAIEDRVVDCYGVKDVENRIRVASR